MSLVVQSDVQDSGKQNGARKKGRKQRLVRYDNQDLRPRATLWDRTKFLGLFFVVFWLFVWARLVNIPIEPVGDAVQHVLLSTWWLDALFIAEFVRQVYCYIGEKSKRWYRFWSQRVFGKINEKVAQIEPWTRYRLGRVTKWVLALALAAVVLAAFLHTTPLEAVVQAPALLVRSLPTILQIALYVLIIIAQFVLLFWYMSRGGVETYFPGEIKTRFSDVWGQDAVLERVKENIIFLQNPESIEERGGYVPGGILLWGPPGTGKTLMAEAVAGETQNPFVFVEPAAFQNMFFGVGVLKVRALFRKLRRLALRYGGVVVFFDEADSLGNRGQLAGGPGPFTYGPLRAELPFSQPLCNGMSYLHESTASFLLHQHMTKSADSADQGPARGLLQRAVPNMRGGGGFPLFGDMGTLQALLAEMSGLKKPRGFFNRVVRRALGMKPKPPPNYRILIMMATNMPESLDQALLRPGRIDRIYKVPYPSKAGRIRTYEGYLAKIRHELTPEQIEQLAVMTPYATGAMIKDLVNEALILAIRDGREVVTWQDVLKAKQLKRLGPPEDVEYIERERHAIAVHEACHALVAARVRKDFAIDMATIEKGGSYLGMVASIKREDHYTQWRSEYEADIMVSLASLAGERLFFDGDNSSGVAGDLESATAVAAMMEAYWGMGESLTSLGAAAEIGIPAGGGVPRSVRGDSDGTGQRDLALASRIERKLDELFRRTRELLAKERTMVLAIAHAMEYHKTISGDDVVAILEGRQGPLVDGRWYHTREFATVIEEYHRKAVEAHKRHGRLEVPLPQPPACEAESEDGQTTGRADADHHPIAELTPGAL